MLARALLRRLGARSVWPRALSKDCCDDRHLDQLFANNKLWVDKKNREEPEFFKKLAKGQSPSFLYIGCSDSRVAVTEIIGVELGELFVHRNVANLVVSTDLNLLSVLTYAVAHLDVKHILVTGHFDCGGIRAAMRNEELGVLDGWLQNIRDVYRLHKTELNAIKDDEQRHRRLVELNVIEQCLNLYKTNVVQRRRLETHSDPDQPVAYPRIHGLVFDPADGILHKLPIDFKQHIGDLSSIYDLFDSGDFKDDQGHYMLKKKWPAAAPAGGAAKTED
ncbi:carbonic anhydrase [Pelagophyceae sp. CCMP2097]|nr:carbonic anhydrase [Pelagophyceae sp. CCMP2097]